MMQSLLAYVCGHICRHDYHADEHWMGGHYPPDSEGGKERVPASCACICYVPSRALGDATCNFVVLTDGVTYTESKISALKGPIGLSPMWCTNQIVVPPGAKPCGLLGTYP
jgi:hypothetical protein